MLGDVWPLPNHERAVEQSETGGRAGEYDRPVPSCGYPSPLPGITRAEREKTNLTNTTHSDNTNGPSLGIPSRFPTRLPFPLSSIPLGKREVSETRDGKESTDCCCCVVYCSWGVGYLNISGRGCGYVDWINQHCNGKRAQDDRDGELIGHGLRDSEDDVKGCRDSL
jgi:hypothetical protein